MFAAFAINIVVFLVFGILATVVSGVLIIAIGSLDKSPDSGQATGTFLFLGSPTIGVLFGIIAVLCNLFWK